jgi:hypothetical protein
LKKQFKKQKDVYAAKVAELRDRLAPQLTTKSTDSGGGGGGTATKEEPAHLNVGSFTFASVNYYLPCIRYQILTLYSFVPYLGSAQALPNTFSTCMIFAH